MGTDRGQPDERPPHRVFVDPFELAVCPVTRAEYERFIDATGHELPRDWIASPLMKPDLPVVGVSWLDAVGVLRVAFRSGRPRGAAADRSRMGIRRAREARGVVSVG